MIRILIADDHPMMRHGVRRLIEQQVDMRVVAEAEDGRRTLAAVDEHEIDVLLLDLSLPRVNGMEVVRRVRVSHPAVRIVVLSMYPAEQYEAPLLDLGAVAYLSKNAPPDDLLKALRAVASGASWPPSRSAASPPRAGHAPPHTTLTPREYQVFVLILQGRSVAEIAAEIDVSSSTVSNHLARTREKLGVRSIADLVRYGIEAGIAGPLASD